MTVKLNIPGASSSTGADHEFALQEAISAYSDEAYHDEKRLTGTGIVGSNPLIDKKTETYIGQLRWFTQTESNENVASLVDPAEGQKSTYGSQFLRYIKTVRTHGAERVNLQHVITQVDGLAKIGRDFAHNRAQGEHKALLSVLKGVALSEILVGAGVGSGATGVGGQNFENDPEDTDRGFYVDLGSAGRIIGAATTTSQGAQRGEGLLKALSMGYKDYEPDYMYLATSPELMTSFRTANLIDSDKVTEGGIDFQSIYQGKFRLIPTRASMGFTSAEIDKINAAAGVSLLGSKVTYLIHPGAIAFEPLEIEEPVEFERKAGAYKGGGTTTVWHRHGYVYAPKGYDWAGSEEEFATNATYQGVVENGTVKTLIAATAGLALTKGIWARKTKSVLGLGILPVIHG